MLDWCSIVFGEDLGDAYHVSVFAGCTGELVWGWGVTGVEDFTDEDGERGQRFTWGYRLHVGCWGGNCLGTCEKPLAGLNLDGHDMRWAVAHFGQKVAGSPLNVLAMTFIRYLARRGTGRHSVPRPIQGGVWVDDISSMFACRDILRVRAWSVGVVYALVFCRRQRRNTSLWWNWVIGWGSGFRSPSASGARSGENTPDSRLTP